MNGALANLSKFWKLMYSLSSGSIIDFVWLIARQFLTWHSTTFELKTHCKQINKSVFYHDVLFY